MSVFAQQRIPSLDGATAWLNSGPLAGADLRGRAVVFDFWTLTCINWLRTEPYIRAWSRAYRDDGLLVIGVHTPEFSFEHEVNLIRRAMAEREIDYPVVVDNDYSVWRAFENHYWPALYFVDREGMIRDRHFGEGRYAESERVIQQLLGIEREPVSVAGAGIEAEADWEHLRTPETYLGYARGEAFVSPGGAAYDEERSYVLAEELGLNQWALAGPWTIASEKVIAGRGDATVAFRFDARDAHLVLSPGTSAAPTPFRVLLDGQAPGGAHGIDIDEEGSGMLGDGRLYQLIRQRQDVGERTVQVTFAEPGVEAYVFTFG